MSTYQAQSIAISQQRCQCTEDIGRDWVELRTSGALFPESEGRIIQQAAQFLQLKPLNKEIMSISTESAFRFRGTQEKQDSWSLVHGLSVLKMGDQRSKEDCPDRALPS